MHGRRTTAGCLWPPVGGIRACLTPPHPLQIKQRENDMALKYYQKAVQSLDALGWEEKQFALVRGVLAGNVFDWGAKAVSE